MFNLFRRISGSVIPRLDRPWSDDPTSNAPQIGRKRRLSATDRDRDDDEAERATAKKARGEPAAVSADEEDHEESPPPQQAQAVKRPETEGVKAVTKGVGEVDLEDKENQAPESIPLPEEEAGELDEPESSTDAPNTDPESHEAHKQDDSTGLSPEAVLEQDDASAAVPDVASKEGISEPVEPLKSVTVEDAEQVEPDNFTTEAPAKERSTTSTDA